MNSNQIQIGIIKLLDNNKIKTLISFFSRNKDLVNLCGQRLNNLRYVYDTTLLKKTNINIWDV